MDNYAIADQLTLLSKLMDIHGENPFKTKAYAAAAFALEKMPQPVAELPEGKISSLKGIGESAGKKITELLQTGEMQALQQLLAQTPEGVLEMLQIKGLGPKKVHTLWKEMNISSIEALQLACQSNTLAAQKGFGEKTQQNILEAIRYQQENTGWYLYAQVEDFAEALQAKLLETFATRLLHITGAYRRQAEVLQTLEWVTTIPHEDLKKFFKNGQYNIVADTAEVLELQANGTPAIKFYITDAAQFGSLLFSTTGNTAFTDSCRNLLENNRLEGDKTEAGLFEILNLQPVPPPLRESAAILQHAKKGTLPELIQVSDIKGLVHAHSNWSDGAHSIEDMAHQLMQLGFEYLVLSDHSKAAFYANGLSENRIREQHQRIDELNKALAPFRIFKSIECDILNDGEMDYADAVLASFDVVIASIHSNLQMPQEKAMKRLLRAIANPYVSILGHMTGRLLTKRKGYPVDHEAIIEACAAHQVVIEINANPMRLDMDWRYIAQALDKGVMLSVNPDAHTHDDYRYIKHGVLVAQKGGLTKEQNLSSLPLAGFVRFVQQQKEKRLLQHR
jgi:DNA polymerase (family 10)